MGMPKKSQSLEVMVLWKAKARFQWRVIKDAVVVVQGEQPTVHLARSTAAAVLAELGRAK